MDHQGFAESNDTLLGSGDRAFENEEIVSDDAVVGEATHRCDGLLGNIRLGRSVGLVLSRADTVDLLVKFSTMVVAVYSP